jgi:hypothetical protein
MMRRRRWTTKKQKHGEGRLVAKPGIDAAHKEYMQGVWRGKHLPEHLSASAHKEHMQGVLRDEHLPPTATKEPMQGV